MIQIIVFISIFQFISAEPIRCTVDFSKVKDQIIFTGSAIYNEIECPGKGNILDLQDLVDDYNIYLTGYWSSVYAPTHRLQYHTFILVDTEVDSFYLGRVKFTSNSRSKYHIIHNLKTIDYPLQAFTLISSEGINQTTFDSIEIFSSHFEMIVSNIDLTIGKLIFHKDGSIHCYNNTKIDVVHSEWLKEVEINVLSNSSIKFRNDTQMEDCMLKFTKSKSFSTNKSITFTGLTSIEYFRETEMECFETEKLIDGNVNYDIGYIKVIINGDDVTKLIEDGLVVHYNCPIEPVYIYIIIVIFCFITFIVILIFIFILMSWCIVPQLKNKLEMTRKYSEYQSLMSSAN